MFSAAEYKDFAPDMKYFQENRFLKILYETKHKYNNDPLEPEKNLALYDANIRYVDDNIKILLGNLKDLGIKDETLIVITSDHGEAFGEYGFWDHIKGHELFNLSEDPNQLKDISLTKKAKTSQMRLALGDWLGEQLGGAPDPLHLSLVRGGWMWKTLFGLLQDSELKEMFRSYPELKKIFQLGPSAGFIKMG